MTLQPLLSQLRRRSFVPNAGIFLPPAIRATESRIFNARKAASLCAIDVEHGWVLVDTVARYSHAERNETMSASDEGVLRSISRRSVLVTAAVLFVLPAGARPEPQLRRKDPRLVMCDGWVLRAADLERLAGA
jgi:hypothetical protein